MLWCIPDRITRNGFPVAYLRPELKEKVTNLNFSVDELKETSQVLPVCALTI